MSSEKVNVRILLKRELVKKVMESDKLEYEYTKGQVKEMIDVIFGEIKEFLIETKDGEESRFNVKEFMTLKCKYQSFKTPKVGDTRVKVIRTTKANGFK